MGGDVAEVRSPWVGRAHPERSRADRVRIEMETGA